jgi:carbonic anhydrase
MLAAIGLILIFKQLPHLLGYDVEAMGVEEYHLSSHDMAASSTVLLEENTFTTMLHSFSHITPAIAIVGILCIAFLFIWEATLGRKLKMLPGAVVVVLFGVAAVAIYRAIDPNAAFDLVHFVNLPMVNGWSSLSSQLHQPDWSILKSPALYNLSFTIAFIASIESLLSVEAADRLDRHRRTTHTNRELIAQGIGNSISGLFGGLPVTAVIVRSTVNISAGAETKASTVFHGFLLLIGVLFCAAYINYIPLAVLAAVLIYNGYKLAAPLKLYKQFLQGLDQFIPSLVTTVSILLTDLMIGVLIGTVVSALFIVARTYTAPSFILQDYGVKKKIILAESLNFLHKYKIVKLLSEIPANSILEIDASKTIFIDHDIEEELDEFRKVAAEKNIQVIYGGLIHKLQDRTKIMKSNQEAYDKLISNNKHWVAEKLKLDADYFKNLAKGQAPEYLFIGCSDSRVPAEDITKCSPGEMFVHRNIANLVVSTDTNIMSVLQYGVEVLNIKHIILCGHYGCGGVRASMEDKDHGFVDKWLLNIKDVYRLHKDELDSITDEEMKYRRLIELNAQEQAYNLMKFPFIQKNRSLYGFPEIHAWAYDVESGYINDLALNPKTLEEYSSIYKIY